MRRIDLVVAAIIIAALGVFGCARDGEREPGPIQAAIVKVIASEPMPTTIEGCVADIAEKEQHLQLVRDARQLSVSAAAVTGTSNKEFHRANIDNLDKSAALLEARITKVKALKAALEAQAVQQQIDAAPSG